MLDLQTVSHRIHPSISSHLTHTSLIAPAHPHPKNSPIPTNLRTTKFWPGLSAVLATQTKEEGKGHCASINGYMDAFRLGCRPHGGGHRAGAPADAVFEPKEYKEGGVLCEWSPMEAWLVRTPE